MKCELNLIRLLAIICLTYHVHTQSWLKPFSEGSPDLNKELEALGDRLKEILADCGHGFFQCNQTRKCIIEAWVCDGQADCGDKSDEPKLCSINECLTSNHNCSQLCVDDNIGYHCECYNGYRLNNETNVCEDINECTETANICANLTCINTEGSFECECEEGREMHPIYPCKMEESKRPKMLFSTHGAIRTCNLSFYSFDVKQTTVLHQPFQSAVAIDYNLRSNYMIWSDVSTRKIFIGALDKSKPSKFAPSNHAVFIEESLTTVDGIAIDWIHHLVYWSDQHRNSIEVAAVGNTSTRAVVVSGMDEPRAIALSVTESFMVWTDWGTVPKIEVASQDGSNRKTIVDTNLGWPNGVTIDLEAQRIFWVDGKFHAIYSCDYNGGRRSLMVQSLTYLAHPFAIDIFQNTIYWSDWQRRSALKTNKIHESIFLVTYVVKNVNSIMTTKIVHPSKQPDANNRCRSHRCSNLCVPHNDQCYVCVCPINYFLSEDGFNCVKDPNSRSVPVKYSSWAFSAVVSVNASAVSKPICRKSGSPEVDFSSHTVASEIVNSVHEHTHNAERVQRSHFSLVPYLVCIMFGAVIAIVGFMAYQHFRKHQVNWGSLDYRRCSSGNEYVQTPFQSLSDP